ncbi:HAD family hydrolase [Rubrobacter indicoceani]|uniref:HAD family hydrolase n=1 Tax=Rubrobacter indicoceani TaxID=2051957 RepID=UPI000E5A598A|nr:HAD-IA family hydrolase [Rubrobacter indicoceani]
MTETKPRALLLDLDGTLAETDSLHFPAWADILRQHASMDVDRAFYQANISGRLNPDIAAEYIPGLSAEQTAALVEEKEVHFRDRVDGLEPTPGLLEFVGAAREAGLRLALVTNAPRENARVVMAALGLEGYFEEVVVADDVDAGKPDPAPYAEALRRLDLSPDEAVAFEDSRSGIASALGAGIRTVGVASTQSEEYLLEAGTYLVVRDFTDSRLEDMIPA